MSVEFLNPLGEHVIFEGALNKQASLFNSLEEQVEALTLVPEDDPILTTECETVNFKEPQFDIVATVTRMTQTMLEHNGIGLSAPQVGLPYRLFILRTNPITVYINPKIVHTYGKPEAPMAEGCLSFPGLTIKIKRYPGIRLRYAKIDGQVVTEQFGGLTARAMQHEVDHCDGIVFTRRASLFHRQQAYRQRVHS